MMMMIKKKNTISYTRWLKPTPRSIPLLSPQRDGVKPEMVQMLRGGDKPRPVSPGSPCDFQQDQGLSLWCPSRVTMFRGFLSYGMKELGTNDNRFLILEFP